MPGHRGICAHKRFRIGRSGWDRAATSRRSVQRIPADDREVPSSKTRKVIEASPLDPAADVAGALRGLPDRRGLRVVSRPEITQRLQKFALIRRRTFPQRVPLRVSDHAPSHSPTVSPLLSFVATRCGDQIFLWQRSIGPFFCSLGCKNVTATVFPSIVGPRRAGGWLLTAGRPVDREADKPRRPRLEAV